MVKTDIRQKTRGADWIDGLENARTSSYSNRSLICAAVDIFDPIAVSKEIDAALGDLTDPRAIRTVVVDHLSKAKADGFAKIKGGLTVQPFAAAQAIKSYTYLTDQLVLEVMRIAVKRIHRLANPTTSERIALVAVGGYGRMEMAPYSDVDLLFVIPYKTTAWAESVVETMLYILWDLRLKVGHATRSVNDCLRLGKSDFTIRTALLECRFLGGDPVLGEDLTRKLWSGLFKNTGPEFVEAKLAERSVRHQKQGAHRYMVEPNVKEGKGGLRDLQSLFWIAKYLHGVQATHDLVHLGVFSQDEFDGFVEAEQFLWTVRCHLHLLAKRAQEHLTFDAQVEIAKTLGYKDTDGRRDVEHFMQTYFTHATRVGELTRIFLTSLEAQHVKRAPRMGDLLSKAGKRLRVRLSAGYRLDRGRLNISDADKFLSQPLNVLGIFAETLRTGYPLHPDAMRLVHANLDLIDDDLRESPAANAIFLEILLDYGNPARGLRRMNELGVLGAFIPEFQPVVAMMQFNIYHHYTVDEHTLQCISTLSEIENRDLVEDLPVASGILEKGLNRRVLFVALLLHDIGKGRQQDHSELGAEIAAIACPRLGLSGEESETVVWLVRNHLLMSDVAQKRDLSDPRTVDGFARIVQTRANLDLLTVLTVCDIRGVGPGTWNNWKAQLLRDLYHATRAKLIDDSATADQPTREHQMQASLRKSLTDWDTASVDAEIARHYAPYWRGLDSQTHKIIAKLLRKSKDDTVLSDIVPDPDRDATRACFVIADHPGIFSRLAGALALVGANVVDARTYTTSDGFATSVFWIQDAGGKPYEKARLKRLRTMINMTLKGEVVARDALKERDKFKKRERDFIVPTQITFDNEGSDIYTIIEVDTRDRPGLLYDLTKTINAANIYIASAVIATYGVQAVDVFYVKDIVGLKLHAKSKRDALEKKLRNAIITGAKGALK